MKSAGAPGRQIDRAERVVRRNTSASVEDDVNRIANCITNARGESPRLVADS